MRTVADSLDVPDKIGEHLRVAVVIPCFNEAQTIGKVVRDFHEACPDAQIIVFDNNSVDDSARLATEAGARVLPVRRQGKGNVVRAILTKVDADIFVLVDGDDTYPADQVNRLLVPVIEGRADMVAGARLDVRDLNAFRPMHAFGNRLFCWLVNTIFGSEFRDILTGYRVFNSVVAHGLPIVSSGFEVEAEMTIQCLYYDYFIEEVAIPYRSRPEDSPSKLNTFRDGIRILLKVSHLLRAYKPLTFFGTLSLFSFALALLLTFSGNVWAGLGGGLSAIFSLLRDSLVLCGVICVSTGIILHTLNYRIKELHSVQVKQRWGRSDN